MTERDLLQGSPPWGAARMRECPTGQDLVSLSCETKSNQGGPWSSNSMTEDRVAANILLGRSELSLRRWIEHFIPARREVTALSWPGNLAGVVHPSVGSISEERS